MLVPEKAPEAALACPAPIAVHDDGYVLWQARRIELAVDGLFFGGKFGYAARWQESQNDCLSLRP
jgi:hypothetical protein